jgi:hypothetical protein
VWTTPPGYVTLVKSIVVHNSGSVASDVHVYVRTQPAEATQYWFESLPPGTSRVLEPTLALNPGDGVWVFHFGASLNAWISGAVLVGEPQFPPATREGPQQLPGGIVPVPPLFTAPGLPQSR